MLIDIDAVIANAVLIIKQEGNYVIGFEIQNKEDVLIKERTKKGCLKIQYTDSKRYTKLMVY